MGWESGTHTDGAVGSSGSVQRRLHQCFPRMSRGGVPGWGPPVFPRFWGRVSGMEDALWSSWHSPSAAAPSVRQTAAPLASAFPSNEA